MCHITGLRRLASFLVRQRPPGAATAVDVLTQFVFRLSFGLALAMAVTPTAWVSAGYYRVNSFVLMGLNVLAAVAAASSDGGRFSLVLPILAAALSYASAVVFLYERGRVGAKLLWVIALVTLVGAWSTTTAQGDSALALGLVWLAPLSGGMVLGSTMAAMLLGHWYLNSPTMKLDPLRRLILLMAACLAVRMAVSGAGLAGVLAVGWPTTDRLLFIGLRWLAGLIGAMVAAWMAWETLNVPNTQSATGILYVGVITTFLGELTAQLLSSQSQYPL